MLAKPGLVVIGLTLVIIVSGFLKPETTSDVNCSGRRTLGTSFAAYFGTVYESSVVGHSCSDIGFIHSDVVGIYYFLLNFKILLNIDFVHRTQQCFLSLVKINVN